MPDLDSRLAADRERFLDSIEQPPFEPLARRAGMLRRRRALTQAGAVAAALAAIGLVGVRAVDIHRPSPPPPAASPVATGPAAVYSANGITINGLPDLGSRGRGWRATWTVIGSACVCPCRRDHLTRDGRRENVTGFTRGATGVDHELEEDPHQRRMPPVGGGATADDVVPEV